MNDDEILEVILARERDAAAVLADEHARHLAREVEFERERIIRAAELADRVADAQAKIRAADTALSVIPFDEVPANVYFTPRTEAQWIKEEARTRRLMMQPCFSQILGMYTSARAARLASRLPLTVELFVVTGAYQGAMAADYRPATSSPVFRHTGPEPAAIVERQSQISEAEAARIMTPAEFAAWKRRATE